MPHTPDRKPSTTLDLLIASGCLWLATSLARLIRGQQNFPFTLPELILTGGRARGLIGPLEVGQALKLEKSPAMASSAFLWVSLKTLHNGDVVLFPVTASQTLQPDEWVWLMPFDSVLVKHVSGGNSTLGFKSYDQGREKWQGETLDVVWFDEEPPEDIYSEGLTRTNATGGLVFMTFTPLLGMSEVVRRFLMERSPDRHVTTMTIEE